MLIEGLHKYRILLASRSPRRQQLLREMGLEFEIVIKEYEESYPDRLTGEEIALYLAREKAGILKSELSADQLVITADTIVWCNNEVLGKPVDRNDAFRMISLLSGNTHEVITGVCLLSPGYERTFADSTKVTFEKLSEEEILYYIDNFMPYDKAGGYGIQEWIGVTACSRIEGSYFNVVGLPVHCLYRELKEFLKQAK